MEPRIGLIVGLLVALILVALLVILVQGLRLARLRRRLDAITRGEGGRSLETILDAYLEKTLHVGRTVTDLEARTGALEAIGRRAVQRIGLVRYNPFEETGGNQSFALALLDGDEDGFIISSLHARAGTRIYAKALTRGRAEGALSDEEAEALRLARSAPNGQPVSVDHSAAGGTRAGA